MSKYPYLKKFLIACLIAVVIIALSCIFLWEWDGLVYLVCFTFTGVAIYRYYLEQKMSGKL